MFENPEVRQYGRPKEAWLRSTECKGNGCNWYLRTSVTFFRLAHIWTVQREIRDKQQYSHHARIVPDDRGRWVLQLRQQLLLSGFYSMCLDIFKWFIYSWFFIWLERSQNVVHRISVHFPEIGLSADGRRWDMDTANYMNRYSLFFPLFLLVFFPLLDRTCFTSTTIEYWDLWYTVHHPKHS